VLNEETTPEKSHIANLTSSQRCSLESHPHQHHPSIDTFLHNVSPATSVRQRLPINAETAYLPETRQQHHRRGTSSVAVQPASSSSGHVNCSSHTGRFPRVRQAAATAFPRRVTFSSSSAAGPPRHQPIPHSHPSRKAWDTTPEKLRPDEDAARRIPGSDAIRCHGLQSSSASSTRTQNSQPTQQTTAQPFRAAR
jgi:hypothetical protein